MDQFALTYLECRILFQPSLLLLLNENSLNIKRKPVSVDSFAPGVAHPVFRCSSTLLQILGLGSEEERLHSRVIPNGRGGDRSCREAVCSRLHISWLYSTFHLFII